MQFLDIQDLSGQQLGQYQLRELLGRGGMGAVFRAYQERLDREVAVKVIFSQLNQNKEHQLRFEREARLAASLEHTNIVPVYDYGTENGISFIAMRLLHGGTLQERVLRSRGQGGMDLHDVARITNHLTSALQYAHDRDVIHRDVKANNVMFDDRDNAILVDFGIARLLSTDFDVTKTGMNVGSPAFMAPEQWRNQPLGPAVDQYTLAILVYYMLTGELLFKHDETYQWMHSHLYGVPKPLQQWRSDLPPTIMSVLLRALAKHPEGRYSTIEAFGDAFQKAIADGEKTTAVAPIDVTDDQEDPTSTRILAPQVANIENQDVQVESKNKLKSKTILSLLAILVIVFFGGALIIANQPPVGSNGPGAGIAFAADTTDTPTPAPSEPGEVSLMVIEPSATLTSTNTSEPTETPTVTSTAISTPTETNTPLPTDTPSPTDTPIPPTATDLPTATDEPTDTPIPQPTVVAMVSDPAQLALPFAIIENGSLAQVEAEIICDQCAEMEAIVQYDPAVIHVKALGVDPVLADWQIDNIAGVVRVLTTELADDGWNDSPISLRFYVRAQQPGTSQFEIAGVAISDLAGNIKLVDSVNGVVIVTGNEPTPVVTTCEYRVQTGDTLSAIALANGVTIEDMNAHNDLVSQSIITVGQILTIPTQTCRAPSPGGSVSAGNGELIEVHDCRHVGNDVFEWYSVRREYDASGTPLSNTRVGGPFSGPWRPGCPQGETPGNPASGNGGSSGGGNNNSGGGGSSGGGGGDDDDDDGGGTCVLVICLG